jgi:hypothetical protein
MPRMTFDAVTGKCLVVFRLPAEAGARRAWLAGDFNDWSTDAVPLEPQADGSLAVEMLLEPGRSYRFRYYLGDGRWDNDWEADAYLDNDFGGADSVIVTPPAPFTVSGDVPEERPRANGNGSRPSEPRPSVSGAEDLV